MAAWMLPAALLASTAFESYAGREAGFDQRAFNREEAQRAREFSVEMFDRQSAFERDMSGSAYQRAVADMRAAGLNPYLAYQQGGASTPSVGLPSSTAASSGIAPTPNVSAALASAVQLQRVGAEVDKLTADTRLANAEAALREKGLPKADVVSQGWSAVGDVASSAKKVFKDASGYVSDLVKTYPLVPRDVPKRETLPLTDRQKELFKRGQPIYRYYKH